MTEQELADLRPLFETTIAQHDLGKAEKGLIDNSKNGCRHN